MRTIVGVFTQSGEYRARIQLFTKLLTKMYAYIDKVFDTIIRQALTLAIARTKWYRKSAT